MNTRTALTTGQAVLGDVEHSPPDTQALNGKSEGAENVLIQRVSGLKHQHNFPTSYVQRSKYLVCFSVCRVFRHARMYFTKYLHSEKG
jgi:hypothetical protein